MSVPWPSVHQAASGPLERSHDTKPTQDASPALSQEPGIHLCLPQPLGRSHIAELGLGRLGNWGVTEKVHRESVKKDLGPTNHDLESDLA